MSDAEDVLGAIDTSKPHGARMYDWYLNGKDHYPRDRAAAEQVQQMFPDVGPLARINRRFMHQASRLLAERGVKQFLDIGTGIPTEPNLHQVVQEVSRDAKVMYVDRDPTVLAHAQALLRSTPEGQTQYLHADVREPGKITAAASKFLNFQEPVALSMVAVLHFIEDNSKPYDLLARLLEPLPRGSCLMLSHVTGDLDPATWDKVVAYYRKIGTSAQARSRREFADFFSGLQLFEPGVQLVEEWEPTLQGDGSGAPLPLYVGVAQKV
ncbi:SAM-dependent methyltransferase [Streptomyces aureocirculatus]|uniref:SAM-dependent methyltransferase n=1 Tax=Streptomyces aureocirculatus TaxID=67275 RepID=UPI00099D4407|nr:SAM-dependent methyltransferase [Streptomyces aureocirculatus]